MSCLYAPMHAFMRVGIYASAPPHGYLPPQIALKRASDKRRRPRTHVESRAHQGATTAVHTHKASPEAGACNEDMRAPAQRYTTMWATVRPWTSKLQMPECTRGQSKGLMLTDGSHGGPNSCRICREIPMRRDPYEHKIEERFTRTHKRPCKDWPAFRNE